MPEVNSGVSGRAKLAAPRLHDPYGRCAEVARGLMLALLAGHLLLRRAFAHRNLGELLGSSAPPLARLAFVTEMCLAVLAVLAVVVLFRRWRAKSSGLPMYEDALQSSLGIPVWIALAYVACGLIHVGVAFATAGNDTYLILRQTALSEYAIFLPLTILFFGARGEFIRNAVWAIVLTGVACALLDVAGILKPGWGDLTGQYPNEMPYGQMTLPLAMLGLAYFIVVTNAWSWRIVAMIALGFVAWRQSARTLQTVVPFSMAVAVGGLASISALVAWRGQKNSFRRVGVLLVGCALAAGIALVLRPRVTGQKQEVRAWAPERYTRLLEIYETTEAPTDPAKYVKSKRALTRTVTDPEVYKLNAVYSAAGNESVINNIWRLLIWRRMSHDWFEKNPVFGTGVGKPWFYPALYDTTFHYGDAREGLDPHNSYLNTLNRYGLIGFLLLAGILVSVAWTVLQALKMQYSVGDPLLEGLILAALYTASFAFFTVSLEGPSYAMPFWMSWGLLYARARQVIARKGKMDLD